MEFDLFKSNICHSIKRLGDIDFIIAVLKSDKIRKYFKQKKYLESLYLLATIDYLSRINNIPECIEFDYIRQCKLDRIIYPSDVTTQCFISKCEKAKEESILQSIPEYLKYNIVECNIRDVC